MTGITKRHSAPLHAAGGRPRPRRQRTPTTHYSDDNPSCFTKKKKRRRGQPVEDDHDDGDNESDGDEADLSSTPPPTLMEPSRKRPRPSSTAAATAPTAPAPPPPPPDMVLPHAMTISPVFPLEVGKNPTKSLRQEFPAVFGRGLGLPPPLAKPSWQPIMSVNREFYFPQDYQSQALSNGTTIPVLPPKAPTVSRCISCLTVEKVHQQHLAMADTAGFVTLYSLHPRLVEITRLETTHATEREYHDQWHQHRSMLQNIRKPKTGTALVTGTAAATAQQHPAFERFQDVNVIQAMSFRQNLLVLATLKEIECWTVASTATSTPQRLWTHSWNTEHHSSNNGHRRLTIMCPLRLDLPSAVRDMNADGCCLASFYLGNSQVKEDVASASSSLTSPSAPRSPLWLLTPTSEASSTSTNASESKEASTMTSDPMQVAATELFPLVNGKKPQFGPHCTAIWDAFHCDCPRLLVAPLVMMTTDGDDKPEDQNGISSSSDEPTTKSRQSQLPHRRQELWLVEYRSPDYVVTQRAILLPKSNLKTPALEATLCQVNAQFVLVACSKGIRLYETETLQLLQVYGEHLALHGQSIMWQDVLVCPRWTFPGPAGSQEARDDEIVVVRPDVVEYTDYLASKKLGVASSTELHRDTGNHTMASGARDKTQTRSSSSWLDEGRAWIIGVPHAERGPRELCDTLHVWDWCRGDCKTPAFTVAGPGTRSKGIQSLVVVAGDNGEATTSATTGSRMRLILCTKSGDCREYAPTAQSDWPGIMFPPDYHVIGENLEYIEDEDELDVVVDDAGATDDDENDEEQHLTLRAKDLRQDQEALLVAEAMERSAQEIAFERVLNNDEGFVIVDKGISRQPTNLVISCQPEAYLRQSNYPELLMSHSDNDLHDKAANLDHGSSTSLLLSTQVLPSLPQRDLVLSQVQAQLDRPLLPPTAITAEVTQSETSSLNGSNNGRLAVKGGKRSRASNVEALLKASINPALRRFMLSKDKMWADGIASSLRLLDRQTQTEAPRNPASSLSEMSSAWPLHMATREEETALALGLLQLSPVKPVFFQSVSKPETDAHRGAAEQTGCNEETNFLGVELPYVTSESDNGRSPVESKAATGNGCLDSSIEEAGGTHSIRKGEVSHPYSLSDPIPAKSDQAAAILQHNATAHENLCDACRGRMSAHICGSRALPIDFDAIARAEQKQKQKEEEEKRKAIAEKRRAAAARRKERKLKQERDVRDIPENVEKRESENTFWRNSHEESDKVVYQVDEKVAFSRHDEIENLAYQLDGKVTFRGHDEIGKYTYQVEGTVAFQQSAIQGPGESDGIVEASTTYLESIPDQQPMACATWARQPGGQPRTEHHDFPKARDVVCEGSLSLSHKDYSQSISSTSETDSKLITAQALAALAAFAAPNAPVNHSHVTCVESSEPNSIPDALNEKGQGCLAEIGGSRDSVYNELTAGNIHPYYAGHGFVVSSGIQTDTGVWNETPHNDID